MIDNESKFILTEFFAGLNEANRTFNNRAGRITAEINGHLSRLPDISLFEIPEALESAGNLQKELGYLMLDMGIFHVEKTREAAKLAGIDLEDNDA